MTKIIEKSDLIDDFDYVYNQLYIYSTDMLLRYKLYMPEEQKERILKTLALIGAYLGIGSNKKVRDIILKILDFNDVTSYIPPFLSDNINRKWSGSVTRKFGSKKYKIQYSIFHTKLGENIPPNKARWIFGVVTHPDSERKLVWSPEYNGNIIDLNTILTEEAELPIFAFKNIDKLVDYSKYSFNKIIDWRDLSYDLFMMCRLYDSKLYASKSYRFMNYNEEKLIITREELDELRKRYPVNK